MFQPPSSFFDPSFWEELYKRKLHIYKLESSAQPLRSFVKCSNAKNFESFEFSSKSFADENASGGTTLLGRLINVNTVEVKGTLFNRSLLLSRFGFKLKLCNC